MFATRFFADRYFAPRYFPKVGADPAPVVGGVVWMWVNGVAVPPANQAAGSQGHWMWVNGTVVIPPGGTWPAFPKRDEWRL